MDPIYMELEFGVRESKEIGLEPEVKGDASGEDDVVLPASSPHTRNGNLWTATAHVITAVIGSGVLSLAWAIAMMGWAVGPAVLLIFGAVTYYTSCMLADSYRYPDPVTGARNCSYMDAVKAHLGRRQVIACGILQYFSMFGTAVGYTITSSHSLVAIQRAGCYHRQGHEAKCETSLSFYMLGFGAMEIFFAQIPDFDQIWWLSIVAAIMSLTYSGIGLGLGISKLAESGILGNLTGASIGTGAGEVSITAKLLSVFSALGNMAFAYSFSTILTTIQDTLKSPQAENKTMKRASLVAIITTTLFYMSVGCAGYGAFGSDAPGDLLTGFGFFEPWWLVDFGNACLVLHLVGAYQVFSQPIFALVEGWMRRRFPQSSFVMREYRVPLGPWTGRTVSVNLLRLTWRTGFVCATTILALLLPFFNAIMGLLGALSFWPLTIHFPVQMHMVQAKIGVGSRRWIALSLLSGLCLVVSIAAAAASIQGIVVKIRTYRPFS